MVDIYGRSSRGKTQQGDLSNYATLDQLRNEIDDLLNLASVDSNEVVIFQDKQGRLKSSNIQLTDVIVRIPTAVVNSIVTFTDQGNIQDSGNSISYYAKKTGDIFTGTILMNQNKITYLGDPVVPTDAATNKCVDDQESKFVLVNGGIMRAFLNMNNNGINNLRTPESDFDAARKKYVDDSNIPTMTSLTTINDGMVTFRTDFLITCKRF